MWYAFWAVTLAFISLAIIWYAMYRENLEGTGGAKGDPVRSSLKFLDGITPEALHTTAPGKKNVSPSAAPPVKASSPSKANTPPKSASKTPPKKGPKK